MNSKKKARTSLHSSFISDSQDTPSASSKHNLFSSCRSVGLKRKRNKSLAPSENIQNKNIFIDEDLKKITEAIIPEENKDLHRIETDSIAKLPDSNQIKPTKQLHSKGNKKKRVNARSKRKIVSEDEISNTSDFSQDSSFIDSSVLPVKKLEESKIDKLSNESSEEKIGTIPISINLTRCDLTALKLKLSSPKKTIIADTSKCFEISENIDANKENLPDIESKNTEENCGAVETSKEVTNETLIAIAEEVSVVESNKSIPAENNSLEDNSDASDFYPNVTRRKKKKVLTTKQRNISKTSPSIQKEVPVTSKRNSLNNTPCYSDSDDDFVATPVRRDRKGSVKSENNSQSSEKDEKLRKKKMKIKKPLEDELNKTGHIRISENKSYTIIHRANCVSYVKSFDNDVNFKVTESDDNQQLPRNSVELPKKTMIIERKDYITKRRNSSSDNAQLLMEMPSIFADLVNNLDSAALELQKIAKDKENSSIQSKTKTKQKITVIETTRLQMKDETLKKKKIDENTKENIVEKTSIQNKEVLENYSGAQLDNYDSNKNITSSPDNAHSNIEKFRKFQIQGNNSEQISTQYGELSKNYLNIEIDNNASHKNKTDSPDIKDSDNDNEMGQTSTQNKLSENEIDTHNENLENEETDSSEIGETNSSELEDSDVENFRKFVDELSDNGYDEGETSKSHLEDDELRDMNIEQLTLKLESLKEIVKRKQKRCESLKRIKVYKGTHDLEKLRAVTLQTKRGCQKALVDLVARLKEKSNANFTVATFLDFSKIPNELVGYNPEDDDFV